MSVSPCPLRIRMIGHSTVLLEIGGERILTDPFFGTHGNPAYRRLTRPAARREELTDIDLVLLSHDHWDHFDWRFFRMLPASVPVVVPALAAGWLRLRGVRHAIGLRCWDTLRHNNLTVWGVPARHLTVTCGFVLECGRQRVYFAGDTYYGRYLQKIARELAPTVALLPVTTFRLPMTMGEDQAVRAVCDLQPQVVIPIHLGLEPRSPLLRTTQSVARFTEKLRVAAPGARVVHLCEGKTWESDLETDLRRDSPRSSDPRAAALPASPPVPQSRHRRLAPLVIRQIGAVRAGKESLTSGTDPRIFLDPAVPAPASGARIPLDPEGSPDPALAPAPDDGRSRRPAEP